MHVTSHNQNKNLSKQTSQDGQYSIFSKTHSLKCNNSTDANTTLDTSNPFVVLQELDETANVDINIEPQPHISLYKSFMPPSTFATTSCNPSSTTISLSNSHPSLTFIQHAVIPSPARTSPPILNHPFPKLSSDELLNLLESPSSHSHPYSNIHLLNFINSFISTFGLQTPPSY